MTQKENGRRRISRREMLYILFGAGATALAAAAGLEVVRRNSESEQTEGEFTDAPSLDVDFSQMADGEPLDPALWSFEEGNTVADYNAEAQTYTSRPENVRVENGALVIQARREQLNGREYTSARINMKRKHDIMYGKLEVEARLPKGVGAWPAIWLRTSDTPYTDGATEAQRSERNFHIKNGEIDIAEAQGAREGLVFSTVHTRESKDAGGNPHGVQLQVPDMYDSFHTYGVEWTETRITFTLDGQPYHTIEKQSDDTDSWPFNHHFHLVINLALGGNWAMDLKNRLQLPFENAVDDSMEEFWKLYVRSVRYYPLKNAA